MPSYLHRHRNQAALGRARLSILLGLVYYERMYRGKCEAELRNKNIGVSIWFAGLHILPTYAPRVLGYFTRQVQRGCVKLSLAIIGYTERPCANNAKSMET